MLNPWNRVDWVIPGRPSGDGIHGTYNPTTSTKTEVDSTCVGTLGAMILNCAPNPSFAEGDLILIHQTQGAGHGNFEWNKIQSYDNGTGEIGLKKPLSYDYSTGAQVIVVNRYKTATFGIGVVLTAKKWNGSTGMILPLIVQNSILGPGGVSLKGRGFRGGVGRAAPGNPGGLGDQGESSTSLGSASTANNVMGGGGGWGYAGTDGRKSGAGGGNGVDGSDGGTAGGTNGLASKGVAGGNTELTSLEGGGAGGGPGGGAGESVGNGSDAGGIFIGAAKHFDDEFVIDLGSDNSLANTHASGGVGAAGSALIMTQTGDFGTNKITALPGTAGAAATVGGNGAVGRVAIHHSKDITGTTNPTFTDVLDPTLKTKSGGGLLMMVN